jgi:hypothetical protein
MHNTASDLQSSLHFKLASQLHGYHPPKKTAAVSVRLDNTFINNSLKYEYVAWQVLLRCPVKFSFAA